MYQTVSYKVLRQVACGKQQYGRAIHLVEPQGMGKPTRTRELKGPKGERAAYDNANMRAARQGS